MKQHSPGFLKIVEDAKSRIKEASVQETMEALETNLNAALIDVREESEFNKSHVVGAEHIGKGVMERDIEIAHPDPKEFLYLYCGGGFRSALAADVLQKMGYKNVFSVADGWRAFLDAQVNITEG
jgi:rhodanese-related sulfurtransferase